MHILIVARGCPNHEYPMNGIFEFDQAKALASIGHKVSYLSIDTRSLRRKRSLGFRSFSKDGVDVFGIDLPLGRIPLRLERAIGIRASLAIAKKAVEINGAPDLVHGHFATYGVYANELGSFFRIPSIYTEHCSLVLTGDEQYCAISQEACQKADLTIAVSSALSSIVSSYSDTPVEIVWNIADADTFSNVHREHHDGYHFVSVGSLLPGKNHSLTINALSILKRKNGEKASLTIVGEGPERKALEKEIKQLDLENQVTLAGVLDRSSIAKLYAKADCFVLPSNFETFGVAYAEAMLAGLPVIATKCGGPEEFVVPQCGKLVQPKNIGQLTDAMKDMMENGPLDQTAIMSYARSSFSPEAIALKLTQLYASILTRQKFD